VRVRAGTDIQIIYISHQMLQRTELSFLSKLAEDSSQHIDWTEYDSDTIRRVLDFMLRPKGKKAPVGAAQQIKTTSSGASLKKESSSITMKSDESIPKDIDEPIEAPFTTTWAFINKKTTPAYLRTVLKRRDEQVDLDFIEDDEEEIRALTKVYSFAEEQDYLALKEIAFDKLALVLGGVNSVHQGIYEAVGAAATLIDEKDESENSSRNSLLRLLAHFIMLHLGDFLQNGFDLQASAPVPQDILRMLPKWLEVGKMLQDGEKRRLGAEKQNRILQMRVKQLIALKGQGDNKSARLVDDSTKANASTIYN
jgi:hypothetical protein